MGRETVLAGRNAIRRHVAVPPGTSRRVARPERGTQTAPVGLNASAAADAGAGARLGDVAGAGHRAAHGARRREQVRRADEGEAVQRSAASHGPTGARRRCRPPRARRADTSCWIPCTSPPRRTRSRCAALGAGRRHQVQRTGGGRSGAGSRGIARRHRGRHTVPDARSRRRHAPLEPVHASSTSQMPAAGGTRFRRRRMRPSDTDRSSALHISATSQMPSAAGTRCRRRERVGGDPVPKPVQVSERRRCRRADGTPCGTGEPVGRQSVLIPEHASGASHGPTAEADVPAPRKASGGHDPLDPCRSPPRRRFRPRPADRPRPRRTRRCARGARARARLGRSQLRSRATHRPGGDEDVRRQSGLMPVHSSGRSHAPVAPRRRRPAAEGVPGQPACAVAGLCHVARSSDGRHPCRRRRRRRSGRRGSSPSRSP